LTDPNAKFGISIHFGPYSVGAHHNEWDSRHMYCDASIRAWYIQNFGTNGTVGYKDLAAKMTLANFDPTAWAAAFKKSKATWVQISAQHHDRFAMWDSALTRWSIAKVGGKRDVVGELATAVRAQGMRFGVQNHILYGYSFQWCGSGADKSVDLYDPAYADLYGDYAGWDPTKAQPYASSADEVKRDFGAALAAQPPREKRFTLHFPEGRDEIADESRAVLDAALAEIAARPVQDVLVVGHTDLVGSGPLNDALARQRADTVRAELIRRGIAADAVQASGRGSREPAVPAVPGVAEPRNRRVEIVVR